MYDLHTAPAVTANDIPTLIYTCSNVASMYQSKLLFYSLVVKWPRMKIPGRMLCAKQRELSDFSQRRVTGLLHGKRQLQNDFTMRVHAPPWLRQGNLKVPVCLKAHSTACFVFLFWNGNTQGILSTYLHPGGRNLSTWIILTNEQNH